MSRFKLLPLLIFTVPVFAANFSPNATYQTCFIPNSPFQQKCTDLIANQIEQAKSEILVQAYSFTSAPIIRALIAAHKRGVDVKLILDKSDFRGRYQKIIAILNQAGLPIWKDYKPAIAHNKVIIIDKHIVVVGSFNFTTSAQVRNAENVNIIDDAGFAKNYIEYWYSRQAVSDKY
jgi:phosphatidylserine/phosphatidylglycerophosphate/cardiolipin synthase-like enzyme